MIAAPDRSPTPVGRYGNISARSTRWLDIVAATCTAAALLLLLLLLMVPTSMEFNADSLNDAARTAPVIPARASNPPPAMPGPGMDSLISIVVNGNVFSATRRAPTVRFVVPGQTALDMAPMTASMSPAASGDGEGNGLPRLSAIVAMDGERRALLQFVVSDGAPRLYRVNDVHSGYRIVRIDSNAVVVASRAGTRTLRLSQRAAPDTLEKRP